MATGFQVTFDARDPAQLGAFWAVALGYVEQPPPAGHDSWEGFLESIGVPEEKWGSAYALVDPEGVGPRLFFQRVPEPKAAKNRVHLDLNVGGGPGVDAATRRARVDAHAGRLVEAGASAEPAKEENGEYWIVLHDPEGNELCVQ